MLCDELIKKLADMPKLRYCISDEENWSDIRFITLGGKRSKNGHGIIDKARIKCNDACYELFVTYRECEEKSNNRKEDIKILFEKIYD